MYVQFYNGYYNILKSELYSNLVIKQCTVYRATVFMQILTYKFI